MSKQTERKLTKEEAIAFQKTCGKHLYASELEMVLAGVDADAILAVYTPDGMHTLASDEVEIAVNAHGQTVVSLKVT